MNSTVYWRWRAVIPATEADAFCDWVRRELGAEPACLLDPGEAIARVDAYFESEADARSAAARVEGSNVERLGEESWTGFWKDHYHATPIGRTLLTVPAWEDPPAGDRIAIRIDPRLSFGTGSHFTTRFCLEALEDSIVELRPRSMVDAGAGSGILSIAAALLGVPDIEGFDLDPASVERCHANAELNGLPPDRIRFRQLDIHDWHPSAPFDIVCANILSGILADCAQTLWNATTHHLILSGIRLSEAEETIELFSSLGARLLRQDTDGEWSGLLFARNGGSDIA